MKLSPADITCFSTLVFVTVLTGLIGFKLLTGTINTRGMLQNKMTGKFEPERFLLVIMTLGGAIYYFSLALDSLGSQKMPPVPDLLLETIGGSNALYLTGKTYRMLALLSTKI